MIALVTGGAQRIGRELVLALARQGHDVAIHCHRSTHQAECTANEARELGVKAYVFDADFCDLDSVESLIPRVVAITGPLSVLVNNASAFEEDSIHSATRESWDLHINSNLRAPFILTQKFAVQCDTSAPATTDGRSASPQVINIVDQRVMKPRPDFMTYSLAKSGLWWLTRTTAQALAPLIRVNAIAPGPTLKGSRQSEDDFKRQKELTLLERGPELDEITDALIFLLKAKSVTGQMICVDGGQHMGWKTPDALVLE